jgi:hypothetical protein
VAEALRRRPQAEVWSLKARAAMAETPQAAFPEPAWRHRAARLSGVRRAAASGWPELRVPRALSAPWSRREGLAAACGPAGRRSELPAVRYARAVPPWAVPVCGAPRPEAASVALAPREEAPGALAEPRLAAAGWDARAEPQPAAAG